MPKLHHLALRTLDLPRLERFYREVFGLQVERRDGERAVWLRLGDATLMLEHALPDEPSPDPRSLELLALAAASPHEREAVGAAAAERGHALEGRTEHTLYFRDPDGRRVGVSTYPLPERDD
ncbi:MAG: VOC family protein [Myxococcales bacterium]|nr:VOC family protein [Myxococcales bacterium]